MVVSMTPGNAGTCVPRRRRPWQVPDPMNRTRPKESRVSRIFPSRRSSGGGDTSNDGLVRAVDTARIGTSVYGEHSTISAIRVRAGRSMSLSLTPNTTALSAARISTQTWTTWPCRKVTTRIGWSGWRSGWSSRMVCRTREPHGTYGVTIACSSPGRPSRTGWRQRGKKAREHVAVEYLETVLQSFSGYIAAENLTRLRRGL